MKPLIGITCNYDLNGLSGELTRFGLPGQNFHMIADEYIRSVEKAGGIPVLIPIYQSISTAKEMIDRMDGVLISGGNDVDPTRYGEFISKECGRIVPQRDEQDIQITQYVLEHTQKPLLGICRGIQVMNVALGGTLHQDLEKAGQNDHFVGCSPIQHPVHSVTIEQGSLLHKIIGNTSLAVNSFHHQAVKETAPGLQVTATAKDGVVEALELPGQQMFLGVQWHPEMMDTCPVNCKIFDYFIKEASC